MRILLTGSVGTGKSALAANLAKKLGYTHICVSRLLKKHKELVSGYDKKRKASIVDTGRLVKFLLKILKNNKNIIIDSHLSHHIPSKYVDLCIVAKCDIKVLSKRLGRRGYNKDKIIENVQAEIFDVCLEEAKNMKHNIMVVDTTRKYDMNKIIRNIRR